MSAASGLGRFLRFPLLAIVFLALVARAHSQLPLLPAQAAAPPQTTPAPESASPPPAASLAIPLTQVADQAEELDRKLEQISRHLDAKPQTQAAPDQAIVEQAAAIKERALRIDAFIENLPDILQLRDEMVYWRALNHQATEQRRLLTARADELQNQLGLLDEEQARWQATRDQIQDTTGIEVVAARVQQELDAIRRIRSQAQDQLNQLLTLQNQVSQSGRQISASLAKLSEAEERFRGNLLDRDSLPLWAPGALRNAQVPFRGMLRKTVDQDVTTAGEFLRFGVTGLLFLPILCTATLLAAFQLRRYLRAAERPGIPPAALKVFDHPYEMALLAMLILSIALTATAPVSITLVTYLLWLGLLFRLAPMLVGPKLRGLLYPLLLLNLFELIRVGFPWPPAVNRLFLPAILLAALVVFVRLARPSRLRLLGLSKWPSLLLRSSAGIGLFLLSIALVANICGFVSLSHVLGIGALLSGFLGVALDCAVRVLLLLLEVFLHSYWASSFAPEMRDAVRLWTGRCLILVAVILWWTRSELYVFMIHDSLASTIAGILGYSFSLGTVEITFGGILGVILILCVGFGLATGFTALLRSVLTAKLPLQRGLPYAISKVTYYCLILLVFFAALARAGVELNKFTVITGALGVGVGFGLQNIVNNFASGLILLFERPIRVGDTVEVSNLLGTVKRIGARSSTISTAQGAEVIVPNSNLLSNYVINWTLSSPIRRVEIQVGVAYGSDPESVLKLLAAVAAEHPDVMPQPEPIAFFLGFGESALNFELRFWSGNPDTWFQLKSDVTTGVARALREADIEIPFPQRDLHLRSVDSAIPLTTTLTRQISMSTPTEDATAASSPPADQSVNSPRIEL